MKAKYLVVYNHEKGKIQQHFYKDKLPDGEALAKQYACSVLTIKKALDMLVLDGLIVRRRGLGTFVKASSQTETYNDYFASSRPLVREDYTADVRKFEIIKANEDIAKHLQINEGDFVYDITRIRLKDSQPQIIEYTWMPIRLIPNLQMNHLQTSVYRYIVKELKLQIQSSQASLSATHPNTLEQAVFQLQPQDIVMEVKETAYLETTQVFAYSIAHHIVEDFDFTVHMIKKFY